jgi:sugar phosphate isomerase/epimerase
MEVEQVCDVLAGIGYKSVEWDMPHFDPGKTTSAQRKKLKETPDRYGLGVSDVMVQYDYVTLSEDERLERVRRSIECIQATADAGIEKVNLFTGPRNWVKGNPRLHWDIQEGEAWEKVLDSYSRMLPVAEKRGVTVLVEACFGTICRDYYTTKYLIDYFNSDYLCINADPSHDHLMRNDTPWVIRQWGRRIKHVHLKDAVGTPGFPERTFTYPLPGDGGIDWKAFFEAFDEIGYSGAFTIEFEAWSYYAAILGKDPVKAAEISYQQVMALLGDQ